MARPNEVGDDVTAGGHVEFRDLRAVVFTDHVPPGAAGELPALYSTLLSTVDWLETQEKVQPTGACILEEPHHVVLFLVAGDTIEVLNKEFAIAPRDAERLCRALFRALPTTRRIHLEILFPPWEFKPPKRILYWTDHMIIELPDTVEAYLASLSKKLRYEIRSRSRRLREAHPDTVTETVTPGDDTEGCVRTLIGWKNARFNARGEKTLWQNDPAMVEKLTELVRRCGRVRVTRIDGRAAAISFFFSVGTVAYGLQTSFDPAYAAFSLGTQHSFDDVAEAIRTGHRRMSLLWGEEGYKRRFGAKPRRATRLSVFRRQTDRLFSLDEAREVAWRNLRRSGQREYWRARQAAGRRARRLGLLRR